MTFCSTAHCFLIADVSLNGYIYCEGCYQKNLAFLSINLDISLDLLTELISLAKDSHKTVGQIIRDSISYLESHAEANFEAFG